MKHKISEEKGNKVIISEIRKKNPELYTYNKETGILNSSDGEVTGKLREKILLDVLLLSESAIAKENNKKINSPSWNEIESLHKQTAAESIADFHKLNSDALYKWSEKFNINLVEHGPLLSKLKSNAALTGDLVNDTDVNVNALINNENIPMEKEDKISISDQMMVNKGKPYNSYDNKKFSEFDIDDWRGFFRGYETSTDGVFSDDSKDRYPFLIEIEKIVDNSKDNYKKWYEVAGKIEIKDILEENKHIPLETETHNDDFKIKWNSSFNQYYFIPQTKAGLNYEKKRRGVNSSHGFPITKSEIDGVLKDISLKGMSYYEEIKEENTQLAEKPESFSDCLSRNGINLEKDQHRFEVGTIVKDNFSNASLKVVDIVANGIFFQYMHAFKETNNDQIISITYNKIIDSFNNQGISVPGFLPEEKMEFARVLNSIQHCKKMDALLSENEHLKQKPAAAIEEIKKEPIYLKEIKILWQEGRNTVENKSYFNFKDIENQIIKADPEESEGYNKNKLEFIWEDGFSYYIRIDKGRNDFNPNVVSLESYMTQVAEYFSNDEWAENRVFKFREEKKSAFTNKNDLSQPINKPEFTSVNSMTDFVLSKSENNGFLSNGKYSNSDSGIVAYIKAQKEKNPNGVLILWGVNANDIIKHIYNNYSDKKFDFEEKYGIEFLRQVVKAEEKILETISSAPSSNTETIEGLKVLLSLEKDPIKKKEIKAEIKKLSK